MLQVAAAGIERANRLSKGLTEEFRVDFFERGFGTHELIPLGDGASVVTLVVCEGRRCRNKYGHVGCNLGARCFDGTFHLP